MLYSIAFPLLSLVCALSILLFKSYKPDFCRGGTGPAAGAHCAPLRITTDLQKRDYLGPPPKPSGDSRGFGGESRSSGMSELSPQAEARDVELATTKGAASRTRRKASPLAGEVPPKGAEGGRSAQAPALPYCVDRSLHVQGRTLHLVSPSVICFANATSLVRGRLFVGAAPCGRPRAHAVRPYGTASSPDGLIRLAALGTWPYPLCPFGIFPPDRGNRPKGEGF